MLWEAEEEWLLEMAHGLVASILEAELEQYEPQLVA
jgi:hypothetical protein